MQVAISMVQKVTFVNSGSLTFFEDKQKQQFLGTKQPRFQVSEISKCHIYTFNWIANLQLVLNATLEIKKGFAGFDFEKLLKIIAGLVW